MSLLDYSSQIVWHQPWWLWLSLLPVLALFLQYFTVRVSLPVKYFEPKMSHWYLNHDKSFIRFKIKQFAVNFSFWLMLSVALSGPEYAEVFVKHNADSGSGNAVLVVLDVSQTMNVRDVPPSRLIRAKNELLLLIDELRPGERLGVILFAGSSHLLFPLTHDKVSMRFYVNQIKAGLLPVAGSEFVRPLKLADEILAQSVSDRYSSAILLMSDGDVQDMVASLSEIKKLNIKTPIYTIGFGESQGSPVPSISDDSVWQKATSGTVVMSNRNDTFLSDISALTNAGSLPYSDDNNDIDQIRAAFNTDSLRHNSNITDTNWVQLYHLFLFIALILFFYKMLLHEGY